ncbi:MFS transporter [Campylobacter coli]
MFDFFKPKAKAIKFPKDEILPRYYKMRTWSLSGVFIGYMGYYLVRNNITLVTPFIQNQLELSKSDIGTITGSMLIAYGISKGAMSVLSDKADPKKYMALGLILCALINVLLGFSNSFYAYVGFVIALGVFQGMGVGPSFITLANWYPKKRAGNLYSYLEYLAQFRRRYNRSYSITFWICFSSIFRRKLGGF